MTGIASAVDRSDALRLARSALRDFDPWVVGGTVRDLILERPLEDVDLVVPRDPEGAARALARASSGHVFPLSERFGAWRVVVGGRAEGSASPGPSRGWQADLAPVRDGTIEADLALRDFTINAMAVSLLQAERLVDPHGGLADLEARVVRVVGELSYLEDPLRTLRMARLACELSFSVDAVTRQLAARHAGEIGRVAAERVFYELRRLVTSAEVLRGLELIDEAGLIAELLPELEALKGVEQNPYHHLDVWGHTLAVLERVLELERDPAVFGQPADAVAAELRRPLAEELTCGQALRFAALLHDIGKPGTRTVAADGRVLFWGHDELGSEMSRRICRRLRTATDLADYLARLVRHHLRLGFLVRERPLSRRQIYRYLRSCEPVELEVTVLSVADRLATQGERTRPEALEAHLDLARGLAAEALAWRSYPPRPPVRGDELMRELGIEGGPQVGELLELLREASFAGEVASRKEAIELARREQTGWGH